jgi:hypothetical protein
MSIEVPPKERRGRDPSSLFAACLFTALESDFKKFKK